ncbi:MAG TPA: hypothetical protein VIF62_03700 [Labilithrix sp.]|jgi:hypothetical protein
MSPTGVIQIAFDRYLLSSTVTRQSIVLLDGSNKPVSIDLAPNIVYDPVARTATLTRPKTGTWLTPGQPYKIAFTIPQNDDDPNGLRSIDYATLDPNGTREIAFFVDSADGGTGAAPAGVIEGEPTDISFCMDVLPIFASKCSAPTCHGSGNKPAMSLILDTSEGVSHTAIGRIAQGSNTGARADQPTSGGRVFGVDMPIINVDTSASPPVGDPGNSWLVYKLEMAPTPKADAGQRIIACPGATDAPSQKTPYSPIAPAHLDADDFERSNLANLVTGREMPYPVAGGQVYGDAPLTLQERETIRMWIQRGAHVEQCGGCAATQ